MTVTYCMADKKSASTKTPEKKWTAEGEIMSWVRDFVIPLEDINFLIKSGKKKKK